MSPSAITVQPGDPKTPEATALLQASHALMQSLYPPEHNHYLEIDALCRPEISFLLARHNTKAIGCAALAQKTGYGEIKSMFVDPDARGAGVADALMDALEQSAKEAKLPTLRLETGDTLYAAHKLYARHGFTICGPFGDYEKGPHSVFMEKHIVLTP